MNWDGLRKWGRDTLERAFNTFWQTFCSVAAGLSTAAGQELVGASQIDWVLCLDIALLATVLSLGKSGFAPLFNDPSSASLVDLRSSKPSKWEPLTPPIHVPEEDD